MDVINLRLLACLSILICLLISYLWMKIGYSKLFTKLLKTTRSQPN